MRGVSRRFAFSILFVSCAASSVRAEQLVQGKAYDIPDTIIVCLSKTAAIKYLKIRRSVSGCMVASLEDFFPLYRVRNTVIDVPPNYHVSFLFGKAAIAKGGRE